MSQCDHIGCAGMIYGCRLLKSESSWDSNAGQTNFCQSCEEYAKEIEHLRKLLKRSKRESAGL